MSASAPQAQVCGACRSGTWECVIERWHGSAACQTRWPDGRHIPQGMILIVGTRRSRARAGILPPCHACWKSSSLRQLRLARHGSGGGRRDNRKEEPGGAERRRLASARTLHAGGQQAAEGRLGPSDAGGESTAPPSSRVSPTASSCAGFPRCSLPTPLARSLCACGRCCSLVCRTAKSAGVVQMTMPRALRSGMLLTSWVMSMSP